MKTNLDSLFKNDTTLEEQGIEFEIKPGVSFHLRRYGGKNTAKIKQALAKHYKPYARLIETGGIEEAKEEEIRIKLFCDSCLVSWKGIKDENDKDIPCNLDNALKLFKSLPELFVTLEKYASDTANFREDLGNF